MYRVLSLFYQIMLGNQMQQVFITIFRKVYITYLKKRIMFASAGWCQRQNEIIKDIMKFSKIYALNNVKLPNIYHYITIFVACIL